MGSGGPQAGFDINKMFKNQPPPGYNSGPGPQIAHPTPGHPYNNFHPNFAPTNLYPSPNPANYANYPFGSQGPTFDHYPPPYPQDQVLHSSMYSASGFAQRGFPHQIPTGSPSAASNDVLLNTSSSAGPALDSARLMALLTKTSPSGSMSGSTTVELLAGSSSSASYLDASSNSVVQSGPPLTSAPPVSSASLTSSPSPVQPALPAPTSAVPTAAPVSLAPTITGRLSSGKLPNGRRLNGEHVVYDIDVRLPGESQPQLEVSPITMYSSDPQLVPGRQIAVNKNYICYGLRPNRHIRILNSQTALRHLLRGHSERITDMAFFADDVHLLASASSDGRVFVRKITEGPGDDGKVQIKDHILLGIQFSGDWKSVHPCVCWHNHTQDILFVGISKFIITVDIKKVRQNSSIDLFPADEPLLCSLESPIDGVYCVACEGDITDLSSSQSNVIASASEDGKVCFWREKDVAPFSTLVPHEGLLVGSVSFLSAPHYADHVVLLTAGPLNRELKLWVPDIGEGWFPTSNSVKWKCIQTLELKSSSPLSDAFFVQVHAVPKAHVILLPNAKKNAIYAVHLDFGSNPASTHFDYLAEFSVTMPILSLTAISGNGIHGNGTVQVYCVQTQAIQQYSLDLAMCMPPLDTCTTDGEILSRSSKGQDVNTTTTSKISSITINVSDILQTKPMTTDSVAETSHDVQVASPDLGDLSSNTGSSGKDMHGTSTSGPLAGNSALSPSPDEGSISLQTESPDSWSNPKTREENICNIEPPEERKEELDTIGQNISSLSPQTTTIENLSVNEDKDWQVISTTAALEHQNRGGPMVLVTPSELMSMVAKLRVEDDEGLPASSAGERERLSRSEDYTEKMELDVLAVETKEVTESSVLYPENLQSENTQKSDITIDDSWERDLTVNDSSSLYYVKEANDVAHLEHGGGEQVQKSADSEITDDLLSAVPRAYENSEQHTREFSVKVDDLSALSMVSQTRKKKNKNKTDVVPVAATYSNTQMGASTSSIRTAESNLIDNLNHSVSSIALSAQVNALQESMNQLLNMQKEYQKQMISILGAPISREVKKLEVSLSQRMEKLLKAHSDAIWARLQEDYAKREKLERDNTEQLISTLFNLMNKEVPATLERTLKKELSLLGPSIARVVTPSIEKLISIAVTETFQRGVAEKEISQLEKSISMRVETLLSKQLQLQFQTSGKQALQEGLRFCLEGTVIPAFERACQAMFGQVDAAFQKGVMEHQLHAEQQLLTSQNTLAASLQETLGVTSMLANTLKADLTDAQRKVLALIENPAVMHNAKPVCNSLPEKAIMVQHVEESLDPTKELARLVSERKLEEAFNKALSLADVGVVSWLCNQVDPASIFGISPIPLSQGVLLALVQQLGCDLGNDTAKKLAWIKDASLALNPQDPGLAPHMRHFLEKLYGNLHALANTNLSPELAKTTRLVMHVVHSLLSICK